MENEKLGIGPIGPLAGFIQLIILTIVGVLIFVYSIPVELIVLKILPAALLMLVALGHLALLGDNFPLAPPAGNWTPKKSRFTAGIVMTLI